MFPGTLVSHYQFLFHIRLGGERTPMNAPLITREQGAVCLRACLRTYAFLRVVCLFCLIVFVVVCCLFVGLFVCLLLNCFIVGMSRSVCFFVLLVYCVFILLCFIYSTLYTALKVSGTTRKEWEGG